MIPKVTVAILLFLNLHHNCCAQETSTFFEVKKNADLHVRSAVPDSIWKERIVFDATKSYWLIKVPDFGVVPTKSLLPGKENYQVVGSVLHYRFVVNSSFGKQFKIKADESGVIEKSGDLKRLLKPYILYIGDSSYISYEYIKNKYVSDLFGCQINLDIIEIATGEKLVWRVAYPYGALNKLVYIDALEDKVIKTDFEKTIMETPSVEIDK